MSFVQRLSKTLLPRRLSDSMEAESRQWLVRCSCGYAKSIWDWGGLRWKAAGQPRRYLKCPQCGQKSWHEVVKEKEVT
jgi:hypothetical protein